MGERKTSLAQFAENNTLTLARSCFSRGFSTPFRCLRGQMLHLWVAAAARGTLRLLFECRWEPLVAGVACPLLVLGVGELLKRNDARVYNRYITLLRLEFDTRLGMHSPR